MLVTADILPGSNLDRVIEQAILLCHDVASPFPLSSKRYPNLGSFKIVESHEPRVGIVRFDFNGVTVLVRSDSNPELIYRDYMRACSGYIDGNVGPYPNPVLSKKEMQSDARIKAEKERQQRERQDEYDARARTKRNATEAKLASAPAMDVADEAIWQEYRSKNQEGYGAAIIAYAERWARLMQVEIAVGNKLEDVAEATSYEADTDGISGFMYGAAVQTLASCWQYGEQLRRWHNAQHGAPEETQGTVNPAIVVISKD